MKNLSTAGLLVALGIIYGDIGTSPLYTFQTILTEGGDANRLLVLGAISCVFWTLTLQTTFKYVLITLQADNHGEGGVFSLYALVRRYSKSLFYIGHHRRRNPAGGWHHYPAHHNYLRDRGVEHGQRDGAAYRSRQLR